MTPTNAPPQDLLPHEIPGPQFYWDYPTWVFVTAGCVAFVLLALLVWAFVAWRRRRRPRVPTAKEKALAALAAARNSAARAAPYLFGIEVCDVLRHFLAAEHHLPATTQTSYEFLQTARHSGVFDAVRLEHLTRFLDKADAIKFARAAASGADNLELVSLAEDLVRGGQQDAAAA